MKNAQGKELHLYAVEVTSTVYVLAPNAVRAKWYAADADHQGSICFDYAPYVVDQSDHLVPYEWRNFEPFGDTCVDMPGATVGQIIAALGSKRTGRDKTTEEV